VQLVVNLKHASRKFFTKIGSSVFVFTPQTRDASRENELNYDGSASGVTIYAYVNNNPVNLTGVCSRNGKNRTLSHLPFF